MNHVIHFTRLEKMVLRQFYLTMSAKFLQPSTHSTQEQEEVDTKVVQEREEKGVVI